MLRAGLEPACLGIRRVRRLGALVSLFPSGGLSPVLIPISVRSGCPSIPGCRHRVLWLADQIIDIDTTLAVGVGDAAIVEIPVDAGEITVYASKVTVDSR